MTKCGAHTRARAKLTVGNQTHRSHHPPSPSSSPSLSHLMMPHHECNPEPLFTLETPTFSSPTPTRILIGRAPVQLPILFTNLRSIGCAKTGGKSGGFWDLFASPRVGSGLKMPRRRASMQPSSSLHELRVISVAVIIKDGKAGWSGYSGEEIFNPDTNIDNIPVLQQRLSMSVFSLKCRDAIDNNDSNSHRWSSQLT